MQLPPPPPPPILGPIFMDFWGEIARIKRWRSPAPLHLALFVWDIMDPKLMFSRWLLHCFFLESYVCTFVCRSFCTFIIFKEVCGRLLSKRNFTSTHTLPPSIHSKVKIFLIPFQISQCHCFAKSRITFPVTWAYNLTSELYITTTSIVYLCCW